MGFAVRRRDRALAVLALIVGVVGTVGCNTSNNSGRDAGGPIDDWVGPANDGAPPDLSLSRVCADRDHDGFGTGCVAGPDCDDTNAAITNECYRCLRPATGCACTNAGARQVCDTVTDSDVPGPDGTCHLGERTCTNGSWTRCTPVDGTQRIIVPPESCGSTCNPDCRDTMVCATDPTDLTGRGVNVSVSSSVLPGWCPTTAPGGIELTGTIMGSASCTGVTGICHVLPQGSTAGPDSITIMTQVRTVDIYFLMDTTASMGGALTNLRTALTSATTGCASGLINCIQTVVPDAYFGVGYFDDFPTSPYGTYGCGSGGDFVYRHVLDITSSISSVQAAVNSLSIHCGGDGPEGMIPALNAIATGNGYLSYLDDRALSSFGACPAGYVGYPCFRPGAIPLIMMFTDAPFHNGPGDVYLYDDPTLWPPVTFVSFPPAVAVSGNETPTSASTPIIDGSMAYQATGSTVGMTNDRNPSCAFSSAPDAAFRLHVATAGTYQIDTRGSSYDTVLAVTNYPGNSRIACNDNYYGQQSGLVLSLAAGDYSIWVDGYGSDAGSYVLRVTPLPSGTVPPSSPRFSEAVGALNSINAKVVVLQSCGDSTSSYCNEGVSHANALANGTASLLSGGSPAVYSIPSDGSGLSSAIVTAVTDLSNYARLDITALALDNPATPTVDERCLVVNPTGTQAGTLRLSDPARGEPAPYASGRCVDPATSVGGVGIQANQCLPGTTVAFQLDLSNGCIAPTTTPQTFTFDVVTYGNGSVELSRQTVTIIIPARPVYPPSGTYTFDVDATTSCGVGQIPDWTDLQFSATTPAGTSIAMSAQTAATLSALSSAQVVNLGSAPSNSSPLPIGTTLVANGQSNNLPYLRVTFTLASDPTNLETPVLNAFRVLFNCVDGR